MSFTTTAGYTWVDGEVVTAAKLNLGGLPTIADNQSYAFADGSAGSPSLTFSAQSTIGFYRPGAGNVGMTGNLLVINAVSSTSIQFGQDSTHNVGFVWNYNATPSSASAVLATFSKNNDLTIQAKTLNFDTSSLAFALQLFPAGRALVGGGSDEGTAALQVTGALYVSQRIQALPATLAYAASTALDFSTSDVQTCSLTGNITFTTSSLITGRGKVVRIICDGTPRTFTFPAGWTFMNGTAPSGIAASKTAMLSLLSFGTTDSTVIASYVVQP